MAMTVGNSTPDGGMGGGLATGWQEASEEQVSFPAPLTETQA